jgi:hypothetical protein
MKKVFLYLFVFLLAISLVFAAENSACTDSDGGYNTDQKGQIQPAVSGDASNGWDSCYNADSKELVTQGTSLLEWFCASNSETGESAPEKEVYLCPNGCKDGACISGSSEDIETENEDDSDSENQTNNQGESSQLQVEADSDSEKSILKSGGAEAKTSMTMSQDADGKNYAEFSNGMKAEIKVMPNTASAKALEVLGAKCEETGCKIELKEVGKGEDKKAVYEVKAKKEVKALGFIKSQMRVSAQIDAETGEIIKTKNAWWGFLAKKN